MVKVYKNLKQLEAAVKVALASTIENELKEVMSEDWLEWQKTQVYDVYTPEYYVRRYERNAGNPIGSGGLNDPNNIVLVPTRGGAKTQSYSLRNVAKGNNVLREELLNPLIEGKDGTAGNPETGMPARPYTEYYVRNAKTKGEFESLNIEEALVKGLTARGFRTTIKF